jgi:hypothetical protein
MLFIFEQSDDVLIREAQLAAAAKACFIAPELSRVGQVLKVHRIVHPEVANDFFKSCHTWKKIINIKICRD